MILIQTTTTNDLFYYLEISIIILVIIIQIVHSFKLYSKIQMLRYIFIKPFTIKYGFIEKTKIDTTEDVMSAVIYYDTNIKPVNFNTDDDIINITLVETFGANEVISRIKHTLNSYLLNNYGAAVNFSIIKDIIDREVDVKDEEISQSVPTPLYLGLAATMIGIIFGLLAMPKLNGDGFAEGINALIRGVQLAMFASLSGLTCTTLLSSFFYKRAKKVVIRDKNDQLSYLQAKLLPELVRAEDTGVSGLKASLDRFAREATKITDNVKIAVNQTGMNLQAQLDVISKVENLNMTRVSKVNLELFDRLETNMVSFNQFSNYLTLMNKISENLVNFSNKTDNVETITTEIKTTLYNSQELMRFLTAHFQQIQTVGSSALNAVNLSDSHFREAIERLTDETNTRISTLNSLSDNTESTLKETFENIGNKLNEITEKHLNSLTGVYNESIPHFDQLDNLKLLPELNEKSTNQSIEMIDAINQLNRSLINISNSMDNKSVIVKLEAIEKSLNRRSTNGRKTSEKSPIPSFFKKLKDRLTGNKKIGSYEE